MDAGLIALFVSITTLLTAIFGFGKAYVDYREKLRDAHGSARPGRWIAASVGLLAIIWYFMMPTAIALKGEPGKEIVRVASCPFSREPRVLMGTLKRSLGSTAEVRVDEAIYDGRFEWQAIVTPANNPLDETIWFYCPHRWLRNDDDLCHVSWWHSPKDENFCARGTPTQQKAYDKRHKEVTEVRSSESLKDRLL